ncbi:MAG: response regulator transcription factor [Bacteroidales bacterium]|nr:response regulator transcription factor [Bacteroidales bacterium]
MSLIKVIVVDDHEIVRTGIAVTLRLNQNISIVGEAANTKEMMDLLNKVSVDILILDVVMPKQTGIEVMPAIRQKFPMVKVIIFSGLNDEETIAMALKTGANGFLTKESLQDELETAIFSVARGEDYISKSLPSGKLINVLKLIEENETPNEQKKLYFSDRQIQILKMLAQGFTFREIAEELNISERTVETHKNRMLQKFNFHSLIELIVFVAKNKIIEL